MPEVIVKGLNGVHRSWNVYFEDIFFNGERVETAEELNLKTNAFIGPICLDCVQIYG